jgi:hypothetical protein
VCAEESFQFKMSWAARELMSILNIAAGCCGLVLDAEALLKSPFETTMQCSKNKLDLLRGLILKPFIYM